MQEFDSLGARQLPPETEEEPEAVKKVKIVEELTDYFKNKIYDSDGIFLVSSKNVVFLGSTRVRTTVQASEILTHDSITDYLEDEIETYDKIEYLGTGEEYKKEVRGE